MSVDMTTQSLLVKQNWSKTGNSYVGDNPAGDNPGGDLFVPFLNYNFTGTNGDTNTTEFASSASSKRFYSTEQALSPQTSSLKFDVIAGEGGFGGRLNTPSLPVIAEGDRLWVRTYQYLPADFCAGYVSGSGGYGSTKWLRLQWGAPVRDPAYSRFTLQLSNFSSDACSVGPTLKSVSLESFGGGSLGNFPSELTVPLGAWFALQFEIYFHPTNGYVRGWIDDTYAGQIDINTIPDGLPYGFENIVFGDYWNGTPHQNTEIFTQDIIATVNQPSTVDSGGRAYISPTTRSEDL